MASGAQSIVNILDSMKVPESNKVKELNERRDSLALAEEKIIEWGSNPRMRWKSSPALFSDYLRSVDEVRQLEEYFRTLSSMGTADCEEPITKAKTLLHIGMEKIRKDLIDMFSINNQQSAFKYLLDGSPFISDHSVMGRSRRENYSSGSERYVGNLVCADSIPFIKSTFRVMYAAKYDKEFWKAFVASQKDSFDKLLVNLGIKRFTVDDLIKMEWKTLDGKIKTWIRAVKIFVQVYLAGEKQLCEQVFEEVGSTLDPAFFANIAGPPMTSLLNFGQELAKGPTSPEKLFAILDMVETLKEVSHKVYELFSRETSSSVISELKELATTLGCSAKANFLEFGNYVSADLSTEPFHDGRIHPLTESSMHYLIKLSAYHAANLLLDGYNVLSLGSGEERGGGSLKSCFMATQLCCIVDKLEMNLGRKAQLFQDASLRHIFLLNNIHYIVQNVRDSDLRAYLGDDWTRKTTSICDSHIRDYIRMSWSPIISLISNDSDSGSSSGSSRTGILEKKLKKFFSAFEALHKTQSGWIIIDHQIKQEVKILITQTLVPFMINWMSHNIEKYVKYEAGEMVNLIQDLFEGSVKSLSSSWIDALKMW